MNADFDEAIGDLRFSAMIVEEDSDGGFTRRVGERSADDLPEGDLLVKVLFSSLNYKDALSASGNRGVTRRYPHTPGIDVAGLVVSSSDERFAAGDEVIVVGHDLGMNTAGGFGQYVRVPATWAVQCPDAMSLRESMIYGTAGFTAAMCLQQLLAHGVCPEMGPILVTGSTGGVGSVAVALLARQGYEVVAATGKAEAEGFLMDLGAASVVSREEVTDLSRPMLRERWAGVVDTVGGDMLATAIAATKHSGCVTCCGLVASPQLATTVFPFILRGVTLSGIDSVICDHGLRSDLWGKLATEWRIDQLDSLAREVSLDQLSPEISRILDGGQQGRVVVNLWG